MKLSTQNIVRLTDTVFDRLRIELSLIGSITFGEVLNLTIEETHLERLLDQLFYLSSGNEIFPCLHLALF